MPKVSIIVPVYKVEEYLRECINSIIAQTHQEWELLLIDDGSPDRSGEVCDEYAIKDKRIRAFHKKNGGVSSARNFGLEKMSGEWVIFVDADDTIAPKTLELCLQKCEENSLDIIQFSYSRNSDFSDGISAETKPLNSEDYIKEHKFLVCVGGSLIRSSIFIDHHISFNQSLNLAEDQIVMLECIRYANKVQRISDSLYFYRDNLSGATHNQKSNDLLKACNALIGVGESWSVCKKHVDSEILTFILDIIRNNNTKISVLASLYKRANIGTVEAYTGSCKFFLRVARYSPLVACIVLRMYFKVKK